MNDLSATPQAAPAADTADEQLRFIGSAARSDLDRMWRTTFPASPVPTNTELKQLALAYDLQEQIFGPLPREILNELLNREARPVSLPTPFLPAPEGTRFVRNWRGRRYEVVVAEEGLHFEGRLYRSLTAIASEISGIHYPGPSFFGLRATGKAKTPADA